MQITVTTHYWSLWGNLLATLLGRSIYQMYFFDFLMPEVTGLRKVTLTAAEDYPRSH